MRDAWGWIAWGAALSADGRRGERRATIAAGDASAARRTQPLRIIQMPAPISANPPSFSALIVLAEAGPTEVVEAHGHAQLAGEHQHHEHQRADARCGEGGDEDEEHAEETAAPVPPAQPAQCRQAGKLALREGQGEQPEGADEERDQCRGEDAGHLLGQLAVDPCLQRQAGAGEQGQDEQPPGGEWACKTPGTMTASAPRAWRGTGRSGTGSRTVCTRRERRRKTRGPIARPRIPPAGNRERLFALRPAVTLWAALPVG